MKVPSNIRKTALVAAVTLAISGIATVDNDFNLQVGLSSVISAAYAGDSDGGSGGHKGAMGANKGGQGERGQGSQGYKGGKSVADILAEDDEGDGGKPDTAGTRGLAGDNSGKPGDTGSGKPSDAKGESFGDLVVLLRNDDGSAYSTLDGAVVVTYAVPEDWNGEFDTLIPIRDGEITDEGAALQEVEFGRMNVARSPATVVEHALEEALSKLDEGILYDTVTLDEAGRLVYLDEGVAYTIDSPLENLAIFKALVETPAVNEVVTLKIGDLSFAVPEADRLDLAAAALAASSDKYGDLTIDEIVNISSFLGVDLSALVGDYTYDTSRIDALTVTILEPVPNTDPQQYIEKEVDLRDYVPFTEVDDSTIYSNLDGGIDDFADAANDAVQVLEFIHDNAVE